MRLPISILLALAPLAGCMSEPIVGSWHIARTLAPPPAGCHGLDLGPLDVTFTPPTMTVTNAHLYDGRVPAVDATTAQFSTDEFIVSGTLDPIVIGHDVAISGDALTGTASAGGDGPDLGCAYSITLAGTRAD